MATGLGKGLGAILEEVGRAYEDELSEVEKSTSAVGGEEVSNIPVDTLDPNPYQPRKQFDPERLRELGESIERHGLLQPVVVVRWEDRYILVAGERRLRAHKLLEKETIRAIVADVDFDELRMRELALVENIQRENLNPVELANSYNELLTVHNITHEELSGIVHKSRSQITNTLRILSLGEYAREKLIEGKITQGHAKVLIGLEPDVQKVTIDTIVGRKLSVREAEDLVRRSKMGEEIQENTKKKPSVIPDEDELEQLSKAIPLKFKVKSKSIEIFFKDKDELEKLVGFLAGRSSSRD